MGVKRVQIQEAATGKPGKPRWDVEVTDDTNRVGTLRISQSGLMWYPSRKGYPPKVAWDDLEALMWGIINPGVFSGPRKAPPLRVRRRFR
jgi:hypothetical protein